MRLFWYKIILSFFSFAVHGNLRDSTSCSVKKGVPYIMQKIHEIAVGTVIVSVPSELRTFALIVPAHPYCVGKSTCHAMPRHASSARAKYLNEQC